MADEFPTTNITISDQTHCMSCHVPSTTVLCATCAAKRAYLKAQPKGYRAKPMQKETASGQTIPTGIAGAADHAPSRGMVCHVCHSDMESPYAIRGMPGVGVVGVCSRECTAADGFRTPMERAAAEVDAILRGRHEGWDRALGRVREIVRALSCPDSDTP